MLHGARPNGPQRYESSGLNDVSTYRTPRYDSVGMKRKAGGSPQLAATTKKRRSGPNVRQAEPDVTPFKIPELLPTSKSSGSAIWDSSRLPSPLFLTKAAIEEHNRRNSYIPRQTVETDFQSDLKPSHTISKRFARTGGPDMSSLRGCPEPPHIISSNDESSHTDGQVLDHHGPSELRPRPLVQKRKPSIAASVRSSTKKSRSSVTASTPKTDRSKPYDANFGMHFRNSLVMAPTFDKKPSNFFDWKERLQLACPEMSKEAFTDEDHTMFCKAMWMADLEDKTMQLVFPTIRGDVRYQKDINRPCISLKRLTLTFWGPFIVFSGAEQAPFIPNLFAEIKGGRGKFDVLNLQARYAGACGAQGMHKVLNVGKKTEIFDGNAYTVSFTFLGVGLQMYLHWIVDSKDAELPLRYEMVRAGSWMLDDPEGCRNGISAFRNAQNYASELREQLRSRALSIVHQMPSGDYQALVREAELSKLTDGGTPGKDDQATKGGSQANNIQSHSDLIKSGRDRGANSASSPGTRSLPLQGGLDPEVDGEDPVTNPVKPTKSRSLKKTTRHPGDSKNKEQGEKNGTKSKIGRWARNLKPKIGNK